MLTRKLVLLLLAAALAACESSARDGVSPPAPTERPRPAAATAAPASTPTAPAATALTRVEDVSQVCMVNNQFMGKPQIPIDVGGKTYYGCCEMCKGRLGADAAARTATDPVTGEPVDKAAAVIAQDDQGNVHYFASADTLARYQPAP